MAETKSDFRDDLKAFRDRMGGITEEKKAWAKQQRDAQNAIRAALKAGAHTVPQIAAHASRPSHEVLWYVMAMKRYGKVAENGMEGDYYRYELKEARS